MPTVWGFFHFYVVLASRPCLGLGPMKKGELKRTGSHTHAETVHKHRPMFVSPGIGLRGRKAGSTSATQRQTRQPAEHR